MATEDKTNDEGKKDARSGEEVVRDFHLMPPWFDPQCIQAGGRAAHRTAV